MGILFNRRTANGGITNRRFLPAIDFHKKFIKKLSRSVDEIHRVAGKREFRRMLTEDKKSGVTRDEIHGNLQELINKRYLKRRDARKVALEMGLKGKKRITFKGPQSSREPHKIETSHQVEATVVEEKPKNNVFLLNEFRDARAQKIQEPENKAAEKLQFGAFRNPSTGRTASSDVGTRARTVWDVLDRNKIEQSEEEDKAA